tara:strand:- start:4890 stop:5003 length:114 start_codon:yes stop_codon:yes gene_type:complete
MNYKQAALTAIMTILLTAAATKVLPELTGGSSNRFFK